LQVDVIAKQAGKKTFCFSCFINNFFLLKAMNKF